ncbi:MAG: hypothetical protein CK424_01815 [Legionella sp.]|nr:MAG: hypothetical protein CK424_01815 [Legionella sp.]
MKIYWKTVIGTCIYKSSELSVYQNPLYRWLMFQDQTHFQTLLHRHHPHKPVLQYLHPFTIALRLQPGPTCLLGLGGGAIAHLAAPHLAAYSMVAIEASREVITLASRYFMTNTIKNLNILHQDAYDYVSQSTNLYQHILIDIYTSEGFPASCAAIDFFEHCQRLLTFKGILALNLVNIHQEFAILQHIRDVFKHATVCIPVPGSANMIVLACSSQTHLMSLIQQSPHLKTLIWDGVFGYMARFV